MRFNIPALLTSLAAGLLINQAGAAPIQDIQNTDLGNCKIDRHCGHVTQNHIFFVNFCIQQVSAYPCTTLIFPMIRRRKTDSSNANPDPTTRNSPGVMLLLLLLLLFIHASVSPIGRVAAGPAGRPGKPP